MKNHKIITAIFFCLFSTSMWAQLAMGKWRSHLAYNSVSQVTQSENKIYAVSEGALFSVDKIDGGLEFYSKLSGLNGTNIARIEYDAVNKQLLIAYSNGNIDVLSSGGIINIPDFLNKQMSVSKEVNQVQFYQDKAYLACKFGIVVLNMKKNEVADTYYIGPNASDVNVLNTTIHNGFIYASTPTRLYKASITEPHLVNYEFWSVAAELPGSGNLQSVNSFAGQLFLLRGGKLYKQENDNTWTAFRPDLTVTNLNVSNGSLNLFTANSVCFVDNILNVTVADYSLFKKNDTDLVSLSDAEYDATNSTYWLAANDKGVISYNKTSLETQAFLPKGPAVNAPWNMTFAGKKLFVVAGGRDTSPFGKNGDVMIYENGIWTNIYAKTIQDSTKYPVKDFMNVAVDPTDDKHFFVTSFGNGLFEFKNNTFFKWHNHLNSTIQGHPAVPTNPWEYMRLDGAAFDQKGNLFLNNSSVAASVKVLLANGTWTQLAYPNTTIDIVGLTLINNQNQNQKWVITYRVGEIDVYDDNGTIDNQSDDKSIVLKSFSDSENLGESISFNNGFSIAQDKNGVIWVGTEKGPLLFQNTSKVFDSGYTCSRIKIPRNDGTNLADYLLVNEKIKSIAIDGANRKWIGTESSGVYLMSENGQETIQHFTVSNSPLLSNDVLSIAINQVSGEVFFGTAQGIVSYQSDASKAENAFGEVYAYPNPVREGYTGVITIIGLVENTQVKITDLNGNLICQTVSNGSIATWDGKDFHGRKVSTGIYLVICANADGTQSAITKIMLLN